MSSGNNTRALGGTVRIFNSKGLYLYFAALVVVVVVVVVAAVVFP